MFTRSESMSIGFGLPDSCSSSMYSSTASDWDPMAARAASNGRHLRCTGQQRTNSFGCCLPFCIPRTSCLFRGHDDHLNCSLKRCSCLSRSSLKQWLKGNRHNWEKSMQKQGNIRKVGQNLPLGHYSFVFRLPLGLRRRSRCSPTFQPENVFNDVTDRLVNRELHLHLSFAHRQKQIQLMSIYFRAKASRDPCHFELQKTRSR